MSSECRACLSVEPPYCGVFDPVPDKDMFVHDMVMAVCGVRPEPGDELPKSLCADCFLRLNNAHSFRTLCRANEDTLEHRLAVDEKMDIKEEPLAIVKTEDDPMAESSDPANGDVRVKDEVMDDDEEDIKECIDGAAMGTHDAHADKIAKLQSRKRELETLLAAKNEELYKLCVQEVKLTGVVPPEAPHKSPQLPPTTTLPARRRPPNLNSRFTASHPDLPQQAVPLIYQYASQLKARSRHLSSGFPIEPQRRHALHRTQTYHLTSHSDYNGQASAAASSSSRAPSARTTYQYSVSSSTFNLASSQTSLSRASQPKEKEWYESSLDSPPLQPSPKRPPPPPQPRRQTSPLSVSTSPLLPEELSPTLRSPGESQPQPPPPPPLVVPFESPKNCTVVESGRWIPYREVSKPFEMSDFYKYSTKFRQQTVNNNNNLQQRPKTPPVERRAVPKPDPEQLRYVHEYTRRPHQL